LNPKEKLVMLKNERVDLQQEQDGNLMKMKPKNKKPNLKFKKWLMEFQLKKKKKHLKMKMLKVTPKSLLLQSKERLLKILLLLRTKHVRLVPVPPVQSGTPKLGVFPSQNSVFSILRPL
jgi:hypothetical protein